MDNLFEKFFLEVEKYYKKDFFIYLLDKKYTLAQFKNFAKIFYWGRGEFYKHGFIAGARAPMHEKYWYPIALNLWEELSMGRGASHNELYRNFLHHFNIKEKDCPRIDKIAQFNDSISEYFQTKPFVQVYAALAAYEALDIPDYKKLLQGVSNYTSDKNALMFFTIHSKAEHYEPFKPVLEELWNESDENKELISSAFDFIIEQQKYLWDTLHETIMHSNDRKIIS